MTQYYRCPKCKSLFELTGTFSILAPNPFMLKCPVCGIILYIDNFGSYNYKMTSIIERRDPKDPNAPPVQPIPEEIKEPEAKPEEKLSFFGKIESGIKTFGIWLVIILILLAFIVWKTK